MYFVEEGKCAGPVCKASDHTTCCAARKACDVKCPRGYEARFEAYCAGAWCTKTAEDVENCCFQRATFPDFDPALEPGCPESEPNLGEACDTSEVGTETCEYGEECCCGTCHASMFYDCDGGKWMGGATDACAEGICACDTLRNRGECKGRSDCS
eukprot:TRINITY_DN5017_c1_g1_i1.p2 TRINITY_DN5017_c1_g1~~TRINITY_DN5017_c1_g1_i1.p2  ORF type:complete len:179 (-),score=21.21 TRINITY_DN5017_c1_g1_i1:51-515(-)